MANYKYTETSYAMQKIREMFDLGRELNQQIALCKQKYSPNVAQNMIEEMLQQYCFLQYSPACARAKSWA